MSYIETIFAGYLPWAYAALFLMSLSANAAIVIAFRHPFARGRSVEDIAAVQSMHTTPTPRIGGTALLAGILVLYPLSYVFGVNSINLFWYLTSLTPLVTAGLAEDLGHHIRPRARMAAVVVSGALAVYFFGLVIDQTGIALLDTALTITPIAIAFTLFAMAGITNTFNLIDGLNGLAALTALGVTVSLSLLAHEVGRPMLTQAVCLLAPLLLGFLVLNYPVGRVFLGDTGAYLIGFTLAWMAIELYAGESAISPWAMLLIFFWPVADTALAIWRRVRRGTSLARPDRLHFHQLAMRWLLLKTNMPKRVANPIATLVLLPLVFVPKLIGVLTWNEFGTSLAALIACAFVFVASYLAVIRSAQKHRAGVSRPIEELKTAE